MKPKTMLLIALLTLAAISPSFSLVRAQGSEPITPDNADQVVQLAVLGRGTINQLAWSPDGKTLAVAGSLGVWLYDPAALDAPPRLLEGNAGWVYSVAFSPDGTTLASGGDDGAVRLWDAASGEERAALLGHTSRVNGVAFSPDGTLLASGSADGTVRLWGNRRAMTDSGAAAQVSRGSKASL